MPTARQRGGAGSVLANESLREPRVRVAVGPLARDVVPVVGNRVISSISNRARHDALGDGRERRRYAELLADLQYSFRLDERIFRRDQNDGGDIIRLAARALQKAAARGPPPSGALGPQAG